MHHSRFEPQKLSMLTLQDASHDSHDSHGAQILPFPIFLVTLHARPAAAVGAVDLAPIRCNYFFGGWPQISRSAWENFDQHDWTETVGFMWDWRWKLIKYGNGSKPLITIFGRIFIAINHLL